MLGESHVIFVSMAVFFTFIKIKWAHSIYCASKYFVSLGMVGVVLVCYQCFLFWYFVFCRRFATTLFNRHFR